MCKDCGKAGNEEPEDKMELEEHDFGDEVVNDAADEGKSQGKEQEQDQNDVPTGSTAANEDDMDIESNLCNSYISSSPRTPTTTA